MNFKIAIPSGNRVGSKNFKTIDYLRSIGLDSCFFYLFLHTEKDKQEYCKAFDLEGINIVVSNATNIVEQRNFIEKEYFNQGQKVLCLDDDMNFFKYKDGEEIKKITTAKVFIDEFNKGFTLLEKENCKLFGIYPIGRNEHWFSKCKTIVGNNHILSGCSGVIIDKNIPKQNPELSIKEEYERGFLYGKNIRLGSISMITTFYSKDGIGKRTFENQKRTCEKIIKLYPDKYSRTPLKINRTRTNCDLRLHMDKF